MEKSSLLSTTLTEFFESRLCSIILSELSQSRQAGPQHMSGQQTGHADAEATPRDRPRPRQQAHSAAVPPHGGAADVADPVILNYM